VRYNEIDILADGCLRISMIPPFFADILAQVPSILDGEIPIEGAPDLLDAEAELFPSIYAATDLESDEDWRKYGRPDLIALFASRREIIETDLETLIEDFYLVPFFEEAQRLVPDSDTCEDLGADLGADLGEDLDKDADTAVGWDDGFDLDGEVDESSEEFVELFGQLARPIMPLRRLLIPAAHRSAWMSSLNGARLLIANCYGFMDAMPERDARYDPDDPEQLALLIMDALGELEHLLVEVDRTEGL
jgi:hypothetical protein